MRLPKLRGATSADAMPIGPFRTATQPISVRDLEARFAAGAEVTPEALVTAGLIKHTRVDVKILASGKLTKSLAVTAHGFSKAAREKIEAAGGTVTWLRGEPVPRVKKARGTRRVLVDDAAEPDEVEPAETEQPAETEETAEAEEASD
jgi:hypothetical protein